MFFTKKLDSFPSPCTDYVTSPACLRGYESASSWFRLLGTLILLQNSYQLLTACRHGFRVVTSSASIEELDPGMTDDDVGEEAASHVKCALCFGELRDR